MQWGKKTKNMALEPASFRKEIIVNQSQRKAKSPYGICAGFWFDRRGHKAKRSDARFIYIYITNGESPSQHVSVGLAEARPNYTFRPKQTGDSAETVKPQGKHSVILKFLTNQ